MPQPYTFNTKVIYDVHYSEIEEIINEQFKTDKHKDSYELPCVEERGSGNGETWELNLKKEKMSEYDLKTIEEVMSGKWPNFCTVDLLQLLCNNDIVPEGCYMIDISW